MENLNQKISKEFQSKFDFLSKYYQKAILRLLLMKDEKDAWRLVLGGFEFSCLPIEFAKNKRYDYFDVIFIREERTLESSQSLLNNIFQNQSVELDGKKITIQTALANPQFTPSYVRNGGFKVEWPRIDFRMQLNYQGNLNKPDRKLVSSGAYFYPDLDNALQDFFNNPELKFDSSSRVYITLTDYRGRISSLRIKDDRLELQVETKLPSLDQFRLRLSYITINGPHYSDKSYKIEDSGTVDVLIENYPLSIEAVLTLNDNIVDILQFYPQSYYARTDGIILENLTRRAEEIIKEGEGFHTEFKVSLGKNEGSEDPKKGKQPSNILKKREEFIETIIAFANAEGGIILLGVSDNAEIIGLENPTDDEKRIIEYVDKYCRPPINVSIKYIELQGMKILSIEVPPGSHKPYYLVTTTMEEACYIRRGSTDRKMKISELENLFYKKFQGSNEIDGNSRLNLF